MKEFSHVVKDELGIHARPAGQLAKEAGQFKSKVTLAKEDGKSADARRLMAIMAMGVKCGDTLQVKIEGEDEDACLAAIESFLKDNL